MQEYQEEPVGAEGEETRAFGIGWVEALEFQFGSAPWWLVSAVTHMILLLVLGLVVVSRPPAEIADVIIHTDIDPMIVDPPEPQTRDFLEFSKQRVDPDAPPVDDYTLFTHEDFEVPEEDFETLSNADDNSARGCEDAISDIPLKGRGVVGNIGLNGGGAGAYGIGGRGGRRDRARGRTGPEWGGPEGDERVDRALKWLARHQERDGHWDARKYGGKNTDVGVTGLATLAFLGAGHSERTGKFRATVLRAVTWLIKQQQADGAIGRGCEGGLGYHHAIAGIALAEAHGLGRTVRTRVAAQKAVDYSVRKHQVQYSGWRYKAQEPADMSVTGWFVMQLKSAKMAELQVDGAAFQGAVAFLDRCTRDGGTYPGLVSYQPDREPSTTMTAVGAVSRLFMGWKANDPLVVGAAQHLAEHLPRWEGGDVNFYYWYYGALAMFQVGGERWKAWNVKMRDMLIERQRKGAPAVDGSWDPAGAWCGSGGRVYSTAMGALCLEIYFRYLPMYRGYGD